MTSLEELGKLNRNNPKKSEDSKQKLVEASANILARECADEIFTFHQCFVHKFDASVCKEHGDSKKIVDNLSHCLNEATSLINKI